MQNEAILGPLREKGVDEIVWEEMIAFFEGALGRV